MAMNPLDPDQNTVSLDDLLQANREQFDRIFSRQEQALDALRVDQRPPPRQEDILPAAAGTRAADNRETTIPAAATAATPAAAALPDRLARTAAAAYTASAAAHRSPGHGQQPSLNPLSLALLEQALNHICDEMTLLLQCSVSSGVRRAPADLSAMITDRGGRMLAGHSGCFIAALAQQAVDAGLQPGDVLLHSDPYLSGGASGRVGDWLVMLPVFFDRELIGFSVVCGPVMDDGTATAASAATTIFSEGIRIPPVRIYQGGELNRALLDLILNNTRAPQRNSRDLMALTGACRRGGQRLLELCERFGKTFVQQGGAALLERSRRLLADVIRSRLPQEPKTFEDVIDDDGCGNGPFRLRLSLWREDDHAYFDWTGTSAQAAGPINCYLHEGLFKRFIVDYLGSGATPVPLNDGGYDLIHVSMPQGSLLRPQFPAALAYRNTTLARQFDVLNGAFGKHDAMRTTATAGSGGDDAWFRYTGVGAGGREFRFSERLQGGMPGGPDGDGSDGHGGRPLNTGPTVEAVEQDYPLVIERYGSVTDSGGAGRHRGGNAVEKVYRLLAAGEISLHDDRHLSAPWGIHGGKAGSCSQKWLIRQADSREALPAKIDNIKVQSGDRIVFRCASGGGWGDPLERAVEKVGRDVAHGLVSPAAARELYGVVVTAGATADIDQRATRALRERLRSESNGRASRSAYDFGEPPGRPPSQQ